MAFLMLFFFSIEFVTSNKTFISDSYLIINKKTIESFTDFSKIFFD